MIAGIQVFGILFALAMCYFTYLYYKRKDYPKTDYLFWMSIWIGFLFLVSFPSATSDIIHPLGIASTMQLFTILAFLLTFALLFYQHDLLRKNEQKIGKLVRENAIENAKRKK